MGPKYLKFIIALLIISLFISLLANYNYYREFNAYQSKEKELIAENISRYINELHNFTTLVDSVISNPNDEQNIEMLEFQRQSMSKLMKSMWNYYSIKEMRGLQFSLISIDLQIYDLIQGKNIKNNLVELRELNDRIKDVVKYYNNVVTKDYLLINHHLEISETINKKMQK